MLRIALFFFFLPFFCFGQIPKPKANTYVNDYTNNLTPEEIYQLNTRLRLLENETTVQMAILLINDLPSNMTIEDYARTVGNTWKVGVNHNGIIYVAVLNERRQRLEIAERLEGDIPDMIAAEIINNLRDDLRQKDYYGALDLLITQVSERLGVYSNHSSDTTYLEQPSTPVPDTPLEQIEFEKEKAKYDRWQPFAFWMIVSGAVVFCIWAYRYRKKYVRMNTVNGVYIGIGSAYYASTHPEESSGSDGGGGFGGFGGSGGGGFSGGGASGSW